jgi:hypothetical protein
MRITLQAFVWILLLPWTVLMQDVLIKELSLSSPRTGFTSIEADGFIYLAGGLTNGNGISSTVDVYNIASQTWNGTLTLPTPRAYITPVHISPNIYFIGGWNKVGKPTGAYRYDSVLRKFNATSAPQIQEPIQTSIHGSTLFVIVSHNVEFLDLDNMDSEWYHDEDIASLMPRLAGGIIFGRNNLIYVIGGFNVSTRQFVSDAWIYDVETANLTRYEDAISPFDYVVRGETLLFYEVANNVAAVWMWNQCILFNVGSSIWLNFNISNIMNIVTVPGFTFIFDTNGFYTVDWTNPIADPTYAEALGTIAYSIGYEDNAVYYTNTQDGSVKANVFYDGIWIPTTYTDVPAINEVSSKLEWPTHGVVFATLQGFYYFNNGTTSFVPQDRIKRLLISTDVDVIHVAIALSDTPDDIMIITYNTYLAVIRTDTFNNPQVSYNGVFFDFTNYAAYDTNTGLLINNAFPSFMDLITKWVVQGPHFFTFTQGFSYTSVSDQVCPISLGLVYHFWK